ncbi:hypothetical protein Glove_529g18 [Diversispora epigaea]|uniref:Uncharacterized protein n=1 Tax=Diversispora epigaea TaxID=1348612 RepID=A0A397GHH1_9GLOM|nr:hypothetical protein Glove_529g18 [Diversispora epigaea]
MPNKLRPEAIHLSHETICEIITARGARNAVSILAKKYLISHRQAIHLSHETICEIITARGARNAVSILAKKYLISHRRIYNIWRFANAIWRGKEFERIEWCQSIPPVPPTLPENSNRIKSKVLLQSRPLSDELEIRGSASSLNHNSSNLHLEYDTLPNKEIKKKSFKPRTKSVHISDLIPTSHIVSATDNNSTEEICSNDLVALRKREAKIDEKNKRNLTRLLAT